MSRSPGWYRRTWCASPPGIPLHDGLLRPPLVTKQGRGEAVWVGEPGIGPAGPKAPHTARLTPLIVKNCFMLLPHSADPYSFYLTQRHEVPVVGPGVASGPLPTMAQHLVFRSVARSVSRMRLPKGCEERQVEADRPLLVSVLVDLVISYLLSIEQKARC